MDAEISTHWALLGGAAAACMIACGCNVGGLLYTRLLDSATSNLRVCGFPAQQLDLSKVGPPSYLASIGRIHLGQRLMMELKGDTGRVSSVSWQVVPGHGGTAHAVFQPVRQTAAILSGERLSADDREFDFALAHVVFRDDSESDLAEAVCTGAGWTPADNIVIVP